MYQYKCKLISFRQHIKLKYLQFSCIQSISEYKISDEGKVIKIINYLIISVENFNFISLRNAKKNKNNAK